MFLPGGSATATDERSHEIEFAIVVVFVVAVVISAAAAAAAVAVWLRAATSSGQASHVGG